MTARIGAMLLVAAIVLALTATPAAHAECGIAPPVVLDFGTSPRLLATLHAVARVDCGNEGRDYDYAVEGYFKVAGTTVARLPAFSGHSTAVDAPLTVPVSRAVRRTVRAAARHRGARRTTLTLVHHLTLTTTIPGDQATRTLTYANDSFLTVFASDER